MTEVLVVGAGPVGLTMAAELARHGLRCRIIDRLEESGLVERRSDPTDRRAWLLYLADSARPLKAKLDALGDAMIAEAFADIDPSELERMKALLAQIRDNVGRSSIQPKASNQ